MDGSRDFDSSVDEASSLLSPPAAGTPLGGGGRDRLAPDTAARAASSKDERPVQLLLLLHAVLAGRWCFLPAAALASSGSVLVTLRMAGQFTTWSLGVLVGAASPERPRRVSVRTVIEMQIEMVGFLWGGGRDVAE